MDVRPHLLLSLDCHSKQAGDERHLPQDVSFVHTTHLPFLTICITSYPCNVYQAVSKEKKPSPG